MFQRIARSGEAFHAFWGEAFFPRGLEPWDQSQRNLGVLRIREPKTRWRGARQQFILIDDIISVEYLEECKSCFRPEDRIWPFTPALWSARLQILLTSLGFYDSHFTPACLRAGGATFDYLSHFSVSRLRFKGRWSSKRSLDHYVQEATALMAAEVYSDLALAKARPLSFLRGALVHFCTTNLVHPAHPAAPLTFIQRTQMRSRLRSLAKTGKGGEASIIHDDDDDV